MSPATAFPISSAAARSTQLEDRATAYDREANNESLTASRRVDARVAAFECRRDARQMRECGGVPIAERLFAAADVLANLLGRHTPFTLSLQDDARRLARLTENLPRSSAPATVEVAGDCAASWERGFNQALDGIRHRLGMVGLDGPVV